MQTVDNFIKTPVEANLLRYAAGQAIFCPKCQNVMDWRKTVLATIHGEDEQGKESCIKSYTLCGKCWDKGGHILQERIDKANATFEKLGKATRAWLEIVDGRENRFDDLYLFTP